MPALPKYSHYQGYHPTTATVGNALSYRGVVAPHTGEPPSEALLSGVAGGIALGYHYFSYEGHPPQINIVTRYSFKEYGFESLRDRMGLVVEPLQTTSKDKGRENLIRVLEEGDAPIVWLDVMSLGYETSELGEDMWMVQPVVVYDYDDETARLVDRADAPIVVSSGAVDGARARIKKNRFKIATVDLPSFDRLPEAVRGGIEDCLALYNEKPPKGSAQNWGRKALARWQKLLRSGDSKGSWQSILATPADRFAGLTTAYKYAGLFWKDESETADRALYADFLREAAEILDRSALTDAADLFGEAADLWHSLPNALLPDSVPAYARARELMRRRHAEFLARGSDAFEDLRSIEEELSKTAEEAAATELSDGEIQELYSRIADSLEAIEVAEGRAFDALEDAMA